MTDSTAPFAQARYQVRFDWGAAGARRIAPGAHVVVLVDALLATTSVVLAAEAGDPSPLDGALAAALDGAPIDDEAVVIAASLRNRTAVAERVLALQEQRGERMIVAIVAVGGAVASGATDAADAADAPRAPLAGIGDQLTAGAVVDALIALGIDHTSPEAAVACAAYEGLRKAVVHLVGASGRGAELAASGRRAEVRLATELDVTRVVPVLQGDRFQAE